MAQFLANCEVEAHLSLAGGKDVVQYSHPAKTYRIFLRDLRAEPGDDPPLLSVQIAFDAPSLQEAKEIAELHLKEFFDYLTAVSNCKFRIHKVLQIFNWEPGGAMRDCIYYAGFANHDVPIEAIDDKLLETVELMQTHAVAPRLRRALKWFGNGVSSRYPDDQYTYFWFVIEILAQVIKDPTPVSDKCPVCQGPLFCPACGISHLHRPYPKQSIQQLFARYFGQKWQDFYAEANDVRNRLMHGEEVAAIEAALQIELPNLVDRLGRLAWRALMHQFTSVFAGKEIYLLKTNRYVHMGMSMGAVMQVGFVPDFDDPHPKKFPDVKVSIVSTQKSDNARDSKL